MADIYRRHFQIHFLERKAQLIITEKSENKSALENGVESGRCKAITWIDEDPFADNGYMRPMGPLAR